MDFWEVIEEFLDMQQSNNKNKKSSINTYRSKIYVFYEFVNLKLKEMDVTYTYFLNTMNKDAFLQSVEYYVKASNLKSRAAADVYFSTLVNFFNYLLQKNGKTNDYFQESRKTAELREAYEKKIKELKLRDSDQQEPIDEEIVKKILYECDTVINTVDMEGLLEKRKGIYSNYISSFIVKLVLLYGLKNEAIRKLKITDYDEQLNDLVINHYKVRLPDGLAIQMKRYKEIRKKLLEQYGMKSERLFFDDFNADKDLDNTKMFIMLKKVTGNMQAGGAAKYAIIQLLREGIPAYVIRDFTDYKEEVLDYCQEKVDAERGILLHSEKSRLLDAALRKNRLFDNM